MALAQRLTTAGLGAVAAQAIAGTAANSLTATGNSQGTALALPADVNFFGTVAASTGTILPKMNPGDSVVIYNGGGSALSVYPPTGGQINAVGSNNAYSVATTTPYCGVSCVSPTQYVAFQSA